MKYSYIRSLVGGNIKKAQKNGGGVRRGVDAEAGAGAKARAGGAGTGGRGGEDAVMKFKNKETSGIN